MHHGHGGAAPCKEICRIQLRGGLYDCDDDNNDDDDGDNDDGDNYDGDDDDGDNVDDDGDTVC